jgi:hypothetical protein
LSLATVDLISPKDECWFRFAGKVKKRKKGGREKTKEKEKSVTKEINTSPTTCNP